jgi:crotonobetaine/carnitine-CoA ligase
VNQVLAEITADGEVVTDRLVHFARETPDKLFFLYGEEDVRLTYRDFADRTGSLAANLRAAGAIAKGDRVSVFCFDPLLSALAMFTIWRAAAVFCPVNFSYKGRLLAYQPNDTRPKLIVMEERMLPALDAVWDELEQPPERLVYRSGEWDALLRPAPPPAAETTWDDVANIFYTSGTTGPSKGVVQPYRWMAQYTHRTRRLTTPDDVVYNDLPLYHVGGALANVVRAAWVGATVACWDRFSPSNFWPRVERCGASQAILLDVMTPWLMSAEPSPRDRANTLKHVHMQPLPQHHHEIARRFGFDFVSCGFGQTESGNPLAGLLEECDEGAGTPPELYKGLTHPEVHELASRLGLPLRRGAEVTRKGYMGKPTAFVEAAVLDERDEECEAGEAGHLCFRPRAAGLFPAATSASRRRPWRPSATCGSTRATRRSATSTATSTSSTGSATASASAARTCPRSRSRTSSMAIRRWSSVPRFPSERTKGTRTTSCSSRSRETGWP